jgi:hypothetical protein
MKEKEQTVWQKVCYRNGNALLMEMTYEKDYACMPELQKNNGCG